MKNTSVSQTEISIDKIEAYRATHYRVDSDLGVFTLRIGECSPQLKAHYEAAHQNCGVFITAYNPFGEMRDADLNEAGHRRLGEHLRGLAPLVVEGAGADPIGAWPPEKSYFAFGINRDTARHLGARYNQDAVVWVGEDAVPELLLLR